MTSILLLIIYLAFISLGLPDSILGSAWPSMYQGLGVPISSAGIISMIIAGGTIASSLLSNKVIHRYGTGAVTTVSVGLTCAALLGFSLSHAFWQLCLWGIPYGLGAGSVDAALNNFVALHFKSRHMSWLHSFWGIGATAGPFLMGLCLTGGLRWNAGYQVIGIIQIVLLVCLVLSLPLWKKKQSHNKEVSVHGKSLGLGDTIRLPGAKPIMIAFFSYCALETTTGLWASSFMVIGRGLSPETAAKWASLFYLGITAGRLLCGFVTEKLGDKTMVRIGQITAVIGIALILLTHTNLLLLIGLILIGVGCAPIYPSLLHETPVNFGPDKSQSMMGMQMASAYVGSTFMPLLFGLLAEKVSITLYPFYLIIFVMLMLVMVERMNKVREKKNTFLK